MEHSYWIYRNEDFGLSINKVPIYFERDTENGTFDEGSSVFKSGSMFDDIWGPDVKITVSWEKADRMTYHHGKKVRESIKMYNAINVGISKKKTEWLQSHECTFWWGRRKHMIKGHLYGSNLIHSIMLCEQTSRIIEVDARVIENRIRNYEALILEFMKSLVCHQI